MKNGSSNGVSKSYCTIKFEVDGRIIENNYRCGNKTLLLTELNKIQRGTRKTVRKREPISMY